jgi:hypothetical protein
VATPASAAASAFTKKLPSGTLANVTAPEAPVNPVSTVASRLGKAVPDEACAFNVTNALGTAPAPDAGTTVTVMLPTPRKRTLVSIVWLAAAIVASISPPLLPSASERATR